MQPIDPLFLLLSALSLRLLEVAAEVVMALALLRMAYPPKGEKSGWHNIL